MTWVLLGAFFVTTAWLWRRTMALYRVTFGTEPFAGPRVRRLLSQRMITAVGVWQLTLAAIMTLIPGGTVTSAIPLGGCGLMMITMSWFWRKVGLPA